MLTPPLLWPSVATPTTEVAAIKDLHANLWGVAYNVEAWAAAFRLYAFAKQAPSTVTNDDARRWKFIASKECVLQLHHLRERLEKIRGFKIRACPSLTGCIEFARLREATKLLDEYFPGIDDLRDAIAHAGANDVLPDRHATEGGYLLVSFQEMDRYSAPHKGVAHHLDITDSSLKRINKIVAEFFLAFTTAARMLEQQGHVD